MKTCATCVKWSPKNAGQMAHHGFGVCNVLNTNWVYLPPHQTCTHHTLAKDDVVQGRIQWLKKLGVGGGK
jgi:hypothetical protein